MKETVLAKFSSRRAINNAKDRLLNSGISSRDISILQKNNEVGETLAENSMFSNTLSGLVSGLIAGAVIGGFVGFFIGIGDITFTGVNWFLAAVPLAHSIGMSGAAATTFSGVILGGIVGGVIGLLMGLSIPDSEVFTYEEDLSQGESMMAVTVDQSNVYDVRTFLENAGGYQVSIRSGEAETVRAYPPYSIAGFKGGKTKKKEKKS